MESDHGGRLNAAAREHGIATEHWLDLSTGINPRPWPVPPVPAECWQRLPEPDDGLEALARQWTGAPDNAGCLPLPGSQAAIQHLPRLRACSRVGVPSPGYSEHARCWARAGHDVVALAPHEIDTRLEELDVLVRIRPNNPDGHLDDPERLRHWHRRLAERGGWLVVDEAFIDPIPELALDREAGAEGLILLRSLGKFFGLAGLRAGLLLGPPEVARSLERELGPWSVSHPARWLMRRALADTRWQEQTREWLRGRSELLRDVLTELGLPPAGGTALFQYCPHPDAETIHHKLAKQGILVRRFTDPPALRFGLPSSEESFQRLAGALKHLSRHC